MKILVLCDKFKGTISSKQIGKLCKDTFEKRHHQVDYFPISDGGDGFLDSINYNNSFLKVYCYVHDAYMNKFKTYFLQKGNTAYIEVAKVIGLRKNSSFDIINASSFGLGEIIKKALKNKATNFYIGLGGSLTNDGGIGMLLALGFKFENEKIIIPKTLLNKKIKFNIISDVTNHLLGKDGATYIFAPQKGATLDILPMLENKMTLWANYVNNYYKKDFTNLPSSGAAGGLGFAFLSVLKAKRYSGINFILNYLKIAKIVSKYDLIITGEGKIDKQSLTGKIVFEVLNKFNKKTIIICALNDLKTAYNHSNLQKIYSVVPEIANVELSKSKPIICLRKLLRTIQL